jgi:hypothetical protein
LSLEDLDTSVTDLMNRIRFALVTGENPAGYDGDTVAYVAKTGASDPIAIDALVKYLKAQSLWDYARFYPMKSAQNAGSGSTVYGLGGLTSNNMTLVNAPTWGSDGVTFDGSTQYGTAETSDLSSHGEILLLLRSSPTSASSPDVNAHIRCGIGGIQSAAPAATLTGYTFGFTTASFSGETVASFITAEGDTSISKITGSSGVTWTAGEDHIIGYQFGDATVFYKNKTGYAPDKNIGVTPSTPLGPSDLGGDVSDFFVAGQQVNGSPTASPSPGVVSTYFVIAGETALTTTQREAITDLINAL